MILSQEQVEQLVDRSDVPPSACFDALLTARFLYEHTDKLKALLDEALGLNDKLSADLERGRLTWRHQIDQLEAARANIDTAVNGRDEAFDIVRDVLALAEHDRDQWRSITLDLAEASKRLIRSIETGGDSRAAAFDIAFILVRCSELTAEGDSRDP